MLGASVKPLEVDTDVLMLVQLVPLYHCQTPSLVALAALATIATPANALAEEPPVTWSLASLKVPLKSDDTVAPAGLTVSSATESSVTLAAVAVGASLTALTASDAPDKLAAKAVVPPFTLTSARLPAVPVVWSHAL